MMNHVISIVKLICAIIQVYFISHILSFKNVQTFFAYKYIEIVDKYTPVQFKYVSSSRSVYHGTGYDSNDWYIEQCNSKNIRNGRIVCYTGRVSNGNNRKYVLNCSEASACWGTYFKCEGWGSECHVICNGRNACHNLQIGL